MTSPGLRANFRMLSEIKLNVTAYYIGLFPSMWWVVTRAHVDDNDDYNDIVKEMRHKLSTCKCLANYNYDLSLKLIIKSFVYVPRNLNSH